MPVVLMALLKINPTSKIVLVAGLVAVMSSSIQAQTLYVSSQQAKLLSEPDFKSNVTSLLTRGETVFQVESSGMWLKVNTEENKSGWIAKLLVKPTPPVERVTVLPGDQNIELKDVRRRTSAITTAAAARGLKSAETADDNGLVSDYTGLLYMENFQPSREDLETFKLPLEQGGQP
ncbi:MAG: hypothetical protein IBX55_18340 [Methyloprofundus sp.]|nr:hypothetical protein [Methyloprofundus sp.]